MLTCGLFPSLLVLAVNHDEVYREAMTDGYLVDQVFLNSLTTESSKRNGAVQASQEPSKEGDLIEGSGDITNTFIMSSFPWQGGKHSTTTSQSVSHAPSSTSKVLPEDINGASLDDFGSGDTSTSLFSTSTSTTVGTVVDPRISSSSFKVPVPIPSEYPIAFQKFCIRLVLYCLYH